MALIAYSTLFPQVLPSVVGCSPAMAMDAIRSGVIEFCKRSWAYTFDHAPISAVADQAKYAFVPPPGTVVVQILQAWFNGEPIDPVTQDALHERFRNWPVETTAEPDSYLQRDEENVILVPKPDANVADALTMTVSLAPARASTTFESRFYEYHQDALVHAALARLFDIKDKPWSDTKKALEHMVIFQELAAEHRFQVQKGIVRSRRRSRAQFV